MVLATRREALVEALIALENDRGQLTPELVVDAARDPASPLHKSFEWNDERAAASYRIETARALIRSVEVEITVRRRVVLTTRYVRDVALPTRDAGYRSLPSVQENGLGEATMQATISRVLDVIGKARIQAQALDREDEFVGAIRAALAQGKAE